MTTLTKNPTFTCTVSGVGEFPLDMLRYDCAYPADTETANAIAASLDPATAFTTRREFRLIGQMRFGPTIDRWKSFGFIVEDYEVLR